jgi:hypothetical protein
MRWVGGIEKVLRMKAYREMLRRADVVALK